MKPLQNPQKCYLNGYGINYYKTGSGPTVLFVHGITTYSFIWSEFIEHFQEKFEVIAIDLLGCGLSDKPLDVSYAIKNHAILIKTFLDKLGIKKLHFVGHDLGGGIGQIFTVRNPEMILTSTFINTVAYDFWPVQPIIAMKTPIIRQMAMATLDLGMFKLIVKRGVYHKERITSELMQFFQAPMKESAGRKAFLHFAECLDNTNLMEISDDLKKIKTPVQIIRGDDDVYLSASISKKLHSEIAHSQLHIIPNAGHFIHFDEAEKVIGLLAEFIAGNSL
jgi:pimeloyl-ACP methyl ester carboxylesterase